MTSPPDQGISGIIDAGAQGLVANANRLGLTWTLRIATVLGVTPLVTARIDGDTQPIVPVNMMNAGVTNGLRVYVLSIPPGGNFIIGATKQFTPPPYTVNAFSQNGFATTSVNFVNCAVPSLTFIKMRDETGIVFRMAMSCFTPAVNVTEVEFGLLLTGPNWPGITGDYPVCSQFINAGNTHEVISGFQSIAKGIVPAGTYTIVPRVRNLNGAQTINMNDDDRCSYEVQELGLTL